MMVWFYLKLSCPFPVMCWFLFREIGTIIYSLGCFPSQKDLHDFIAKVKNSLHLCFGHIMDKNNC